MTGRTHSDEQTIASQKAAMQSLADSNKSLRAQIAGLRAQVRELVAALEAAHSFIGDEYADPKSQALDGEHVSREARPVWHKICAALARARDEGDAP